MRTFFVVAAIAIAVLASTDVELELNADVNLTNAASDFSFRFTTTQVSSLLSVKSLEWVSVSVDASTASSSAKASADAMIAVGIPPTLISLPFSVLAYGTGAAAVDTNFGNFISDLVVSHKLGASFSGGVVALTAFGLIEMTPDNKPVGQLYDFVHTCNGEEIKDEKDDLHGVTCTFSPSGTPADITFTYVTSKTAGVLKYGNTPVSPRSFEMIIEVSGFKLTNKDNHARLVLGLLTANGAGHVEGSANIVHREGQEDIYVAASTKAVVNGKTVAVNVTVNTDAETFDTTSKIILQAALGGSIDAKIANVDFPAGEESFVYDPALGAGKEVYSAYDAASTVALSAFVALLCALLYLF